MVEAQNPSWLKKTTEVVREEEAKNREVELLREKHLATITSTLAPQLENVKNAIVVWQKLDVERILKDLGPFLGTAEWLEVWFAHKDGTKSWKVGVPSGNSSEEMILKIGQDLTRQLSKVEEDPQKIVFHAVGQSLGYARTVGPPSEDSESYDRTLSLWLMQGHILVGRTYDRKVSLMEVASGSTPTDLELALDEYLSKMPKATTAFREFVKKPST